ncbi:ABC transporter substrate-binding protein [Marinomonas mediterranea]|jgi:ABC-type Fe3+-hydroxamate transport system, periplasmic component|uniref:ABC-type transporter, periplasmic subunit n=1 Tax=Marinomonas mediterranea (strain ATCC 700492 / JCM 21426 / NBRC 103028 / MMB-1) TaxID=717774 RepID=F2K3R6_MARM1|nr:ABC transporter substrate-binding protein [Marinomonas mediterranea]ADZ90165.1 ABC-type transporter, periplasmic subunit [Marinomonas mediterranea MMB-1]WCN08228.1 ABC transporter substrate-binding protein [Marinomonas mediterranea]WCN12295.1 ABC transporter substrate-binding protein [Marinomonas mediterranea]WCN16367.1 ABC transporter substrate-binding protein [Marinomonas mediterranea MMB-1]
MFSIRSAVRRSLVSTSVLLSSSILLSSNALADVTLPTKFGDVTVKDNAERIVTLYEGALDAMTAIDVDVLGSISTRGGDGVAEYISDQVPNIQIVGTTKETNIEAVLGLRPDVIMAPYYLSESQYKILSKIAPTIAPNFDRSNAAVWEKETLFFAKAINKTADAEIAIDNVHKLAKSTKATLEATIPADQREAMVARWMPQGPIVMADYLFASGLLSSVGLEPTHKNLLKGKRPHSSPLSLENLSVVDTDWLFLATLNKDGKDALEAAKKSPSFSRLNVVKQDRVTLVDGQTWTSASGPIAATEVINNVADALLTKPSTN